MENSLSSKIELFINTVLSSMEYIVMSSDENNCEKILLIVSIIVCE